MSIKSVQISLVLMLLFSFPALAQLSWTGDETATVYVDVNTQWTGSGLTVSEGEHVVFRAVGTYSVWGADGNHWWHWMGPDGWLIEGGDSQTSPLPDWPAGCLTARIGNGERFFVGSFNNIVAPASGELYFGINESGPFSDNRGSINVYIWTPCPPTAADDPPPLSRDELQLMPNYPNPFNPNTTISFSQPEPGLARVAIYEVTGRLVKVLLDEYGDAGQHQIVWDGRDSNGNASSSGCYFARVEANGESRSREIVLLR